MKSALLKKSFFDETGTAGATSSIPDAPSATLVFAKPPCDGDDRQAREQHVDELVRDCLAVLGVLEGEELTGAVNDAADLLALVAGQDTEQGDDGIYTMHDLSKR